MRGKGGCPFDLNEELGHWPAYQPDALLLQLVVDNKICPDYCLLWRTLIIIIFYLSTLSRTTSTLGQHHVLPDGIVDLVTVPVPHPAATSVMTFSQPWVIGLSELAVRRSYSVR